MLCVSVSLPVLSLSGTWPSALGLNVWLVLNQTWRLSTQNVVGTRCSPTQRSTSNKLSGCFFFHITENRKKLIRTGRLGTRFSSTVIFPCNDCCLNLDFFFFFLTFFFNFFVQTLSSCAPFFVFFSLSKSWYCCREGERKGERTFFMCAGM